MQHTHDWVSKVRGSQWVLSILKSEPNNGYMVDNIDLASWRNITNYDGYNWRALPKRWVDLNPESDDALYAEDDDEVYQIVNMKEYFGENERLAIVPVGDINQKLFDFLENEVMERFVQG